MGRPPADYATPRVSATGGGGHGWLLAWLARLAWLAKRAWPAKLAKLVLRAKVA